jgi:adenosylcobinamide-GDP ribazoletransferase
MGAGWPGRFSPVARDIGDALRFFTRLRVAEPAPVAPLNLGRIAWASPIAGAAVGLIGAAILALTALLGLPALLRAGLTTAALVAATGALHEDGLADTVDGFGGGDTRERKLAIMRDSRIGVYGVCALALSILIRAGALASLADPGWVAWALIGAHGAARATLPVFMHFVGPARPDGLAHEAGQPSREQAIAAAILGILILIVSLGFEAALIGTILLAIVVALMARLSTAQIGGQTGDVNGALEQASEIVILLVAMR